MGGKPSRGTPADQRLRENRPGKTPPPPPKPKPQPAKRPVKK